MNSKTEKIDAIFRRTESDFFLDNNDKLVYECPIFQRSKKAEETKIRFLRIYDHFLIISKVIFSTL